MFRSFDAFGTLETPQLILCNPNGDELNVISHALNIKLKMRYNSFSELEFVVPKEANGISVPYYNLIQQMRFVKVDGFGVFVIGKTSEFNDGIVCKKTVPCKSIDSLIGYKKLVGFKGTYKLWDLFGGDSILKTFFEYFPDWSIGDISPELLTKYRTYDEAEVIWYDFLINTLEEDFDCVFTFDTFNKKINALTTRNAVYKTDIYLSYENLIKTVNIEPVDEEIQTVLEVHGRDDLSINLVNPLGTSRIYNFSHFKNTDWIHQDTIDALTLWENKIAQYQPIYANNLTLLRTKNTEILQLHVELYELETQLKSLEGVLASQVSDIELNNGSHNTSSQKALVDAKQVEISNKNNQITIKNAEITSVNNILKNINAQLSFENNFTQSQLEDINSITKVGTYINDSFVQTSIMTDVEVQNEAQGLYDIAQTVLDRVSQPRYGFTSEIVNFLAIPKFKIFADQLQLGCEVCVSLNDDSEFYPVLIEYEIEFDDLSSAKMTFCNSMRLSTQEFTLAELFKDVNTTTSAVSTGKGKWEDWTNYSKNSFDNFINNALDLKTKELISTSGQSFIIDQNGIRGKKLLANDTYSPNQLWITNNSICMTKDNWTTNSLAIGEIIFNGVKQYGIATDVLVGNIIAGQNLVIKNQNNSVTIDGTGITATNASLTLTRSDNSSKIYLNSTDGIKIQSMQGGVLKDVFYVDASGNLNFKGSLTGATGTFSGSISGSSFIGGSINIGNGRFTVDSSGHCIAKSFEGQNADFSSCNIQNSNFSSGTIQGTNIIGNTITGGTIKGTTITGSTINGGTINVDTDVTVGSTIYMQGNNCSIRFGSLASLNSDGNSFTISGMINADVIDTGMLMIDGEWAATEEYVDNIASELNTRIDDLFDYLNTEFFFNAVFNDSSKLLKFYNANGSQVVDVDLSDLGA
jgi:hypothetical protein